MLNLLFCTVAADHMYLFKIFVVSLAERVERLVAKADSIGERNSSMQKVLNSTTLNSFETAFTCLLLFLCGKTSGIWSLI